MKGVKEAPTATSPKPEVKGRSLTWPPDLLIGLEAMILLPPESVIHLSCAQSMIFVYMYNNKTKHAHSPKKFVYTFTAHRPTHHKG